MASSLEQWERAEKERSSNEASHADTSSLRADPLDIARYFDPPANTIHPLEYCFHVLGDVRGKTILEYGCGDGVNTLLLAQRGANVIALDLSPELISLARKRLEANNIRGGVDFIVGSAHDLPIFAESIDVVVGIAILHHLDLNLSSREVMRVMKTGGKAIFQEPIRNSKIMRLVRNLIPYTSPNVSPFERPLTDKELRDFGHGCSTYHAKPFILPWSSVIYYLLPFLRRYTTTACLKFDSAVLRVFPALGYFSPVTVIEMTK